MASNFIALDIQSGLIVELWQCQGKELVVCHPFPIHKDATNKRCTQTIILGGEVTAACLAHLQVQPWGLVYSDLPNHSVLVTWGDAIAEWWSASSGDTKKADVPDWVAGGCLLTTKQWSIAGLVTKIWHKLISVRHWETMNIPDFDLHEIITYKLKATPRITLPGR